MKTHHLFIHVVAILTMLRRYPEALQLIGELLRELKKMDDKDLLVEVQLLESKVWTWKLLSFSTLPEHIHPIACAFTKINHFACNFHNMSSITSLFFRSSMRWAICQRLEQLWRPLVQRQTPFTVPRSCKLNLIFNLVCYMLLMREISKRPSRTFTKLLNAMIPSPARRYPSK